MRKNVIVISAALLLTFTGVSLLYAEGRSVRTTEMKMAENETHHFEVKPESLEGYRIPYMNVTVEITDQETGEKKTVELHPMFSGNFHYGANVSLKPKKYTLRFRLDPPTFVRGHARAKMWLHPVEETFAFDASAKFGKSMKIGSKTTEDMKISFETEHAEEMFVIDEKGHHRH